MPGFEVPETNLRLIDRKYRCPSCKYLLRDPVQAKCTPGHHYCRTCLGRLKLSWNIMSTLGLSDKNMQCIVDGEYFSESKVFLDRLVEREILSIRVNCVWHIKGCKWMGEVRGFELHSSSCDFHLETCVKAECGMVMERRHLTEHIRNECMFRQVTCDLCGEQVVACQVEGIHQECCPGILIGCQYCRIQQIPRGKMQNHLDPIEGDCEAVELSCPYTITGCPYKEKVQRAQLREHLTESVQPHLNMILLFMRHFEENVQRLTVDRANSLEGNQRATSVFRAVQQLCTEISNSKVRNSRVQSNIDGIKQRVQELERKWEGLRTNLDGAPLRANPPPVRGPERPWNLNDLQQQCAETARSCRRLCEDLSQLRRSLAARMTELEGSMVIYERRLNELTSRVESSYDGTLFWKIQNMRRWLRHGNAPMTSPCFYTSRRGYKMHVMLLRDTSYISLFIVIMRGEVDGRLRWPFQQKVTMKVLDQDNSQDLVHIIHPDGSAPYAKPTTDVNAPSPCPALWQISDLNNHAYIKEDTMFIEVIVDTCGL